MPDGTPAAGERELEVLLSDEETFPPPPEFTAQANASDPAIYEEAERDPEGWWERWARELDWAEHWSQVLEWNPPWAKWFVGGKLNASHNCLDRHVDAGLGERVAYYWEGEDGERKTITYADLLETTKRFANALKGLGVERDDRVAIYLPMIPEAPAAMLACARIGAPHSVVFGGFSAEARQGPHQRLRGEGPGHGRLLAAARQAAPDEGERRQGPAELPLDRALRGGAPHRRRRALDGGARRLVARGRASRHRPTARPSRFDSEQMLYLLYTSGTTGEAEGHRAHDRRLHDRRHGHAPAGVRHQARDRRLLVLRRHRLGHRPQLHRLRAARERVHVDPLRGRAGLPGQGPLVGHRRALQGDHLLHRADGDPCLHQVGPRVPGAPRPELAAAARQRRRADQPARLDLVPRGDRRRAAARSSTPGGRPRPGTS